MIWGFGHSFWPGLRVQKIEKKEAFNKNDDPPEQTNRGSKRSKKATSRAFLQFFWVKRTWEFNDFKHLQAKVVETCHLYHFSP